jgi:hypothetical protein
MRLLILFAQCLLVLSAILTPAQGAALPPEDPRNAIASGRDIPPATQIRSRWLRPSSQPHGSPFADVLRTHFSMVGSCAACGYPLRAAPEPAELLLFGTTLAALGFVVRRRLRSRRGAERT